MPDLDWPFECRVWGCSCSKWGQSKQGGGQESEVSISHHRLTADFFSLWLFQYTNRQDWQNILVKMMFPLWLLWLCYQCLMLTVCQGFEYRKWLE